jgi:hypothetical protein
MSIQGQMYCTTSVGMFLIIEHPVRHWALGGMGRPGTQWRLWAFYLMYIKCSCYLWAQVFTPDCIVLGSVVAVRWTNCRC